MLLTGLVFTGLGILPVIVSQSYGAIFLTPIGCVFLLWAYFSYRSGKQIAEVERRSETGIAPQ
jgi:hypothetical protein